VAPLLASNCGFDVKGGWTQHFASRFAGQPFKSVSLSFRNSQGVHFSRKGEFVATATGVEGSLIYAVSSLLRDEIIRTGSATFLLDLMPDMPAERVLAEVRHPRGTRSLSSHLKSRLHIDGIKSAILHEMLAKDHFDHPEQLAAAIKALPITVTATRPIDEAISTAAASCLRP
jgi:predicted flavoprotein YhiN